MKPCSLCHQCNVKFYIDFSNFFNISEVKVNQAERLKNPPTVTILLSTELNVKAELCFIIILGRNMITIIDISIITRVYRELAVLEKMSG